MRVKRERRTETLKQHKERELDRDTHALKGERHGKRKLRIKGEDMHRKTEERNGQREKEEKRKERGSRETDRERKETDRLTHGERLLERGRGRKWRRRQG